MTQPAPRRLLVTGPRQWTDRWTLDKALWRAWTDLGRGPVVLVCGGARGFDRIAEWIWRHHKLPVDRHLPDWNANPGTAGHLRNQQMVDSGANLALAGLMACAAPDCRQPVPHGTHGTADCIRRAESAGIQVRRLQPASWRDSPTLARPQDGTGS